MSVNDRTWATAWRRPPAADGKAAGSSSPLGFGHLPLFTRIFAVVVGGIFCAQMINFAIILVVRLPQPPAYAVNEIARALESGDVSNGMIRVKAGDPPSSGQQDQRDRDIRSSLARHLRVSEDRVRVKVDRPPAIIDLAKGISEDKSKKSIDFHKNGLDESNRSELIIGSFTAALQLDDGQWRLASSRGGFIEPWQWQSLAWLLATLIVAVPLAWIMARRVARPVQLFSAAAERLGRDPNSPQLADPRGPPEITAAVVAFNDMQARLKQYVDDRTTMVAAIAHDLRTPLMRLTLLVENAPPPIQKAAETEIREMTQRIRGALNFFRDASAPIRRQKLELRPLVESVVDQMIDQGADVDVAPGDDVTLEGDPAGLRSMVTNLLENAVKYAGDARVSLRVMDDWAFVAISDNGPGLPENELEKVFSPFYRGESSRNRDTGGAGLGLASARAVARSHGGDITLHNIAEGGLSAVVALPLARRVNA
nr:HAMP domain-containing sensor histidine kinase [Rhizobium sp. ACO-34A]